MVVKDLRSLKYQDLQKLAKSAGIRANQKIDKLIKALEDHYVENNEVLQVQEKKKIYGTPSSGKKPSVAGTHKLTRTQQLLQSTAKGNVMKLKSEDSTPSQPAMAVSNKTPSSAILTAPEFNSVSSSGKQQKKRRRTFELDEPTLSAANTPTSDPVGEKRSTRGSSKTNTPVETEPAGKRQRRNTYDKTDSPAQGASPGTASMIASIDANQSSAERKANLLSAIDKRVQSKVAASPSKNTAQPSQIPRFMAYLASMKKESQPKPVTPGNKDWTKIHGKEFSRFDSLDVYLEKKQQRKDLLTGSGKRLNPRLTSKPNTKIAKPVVKPQVAVKPFVPTVTSTKNLNFNFSGSSSTQSVNSLTVPKSANKSGAPQSASKTPRMTTPSITNTRKSVGSMNKATPFKFTGGGTGTANTMNTTVSATKKPVFDLKSSLARPLTWKPHTGKLQPLDTNSSSVIPRPTAPVVKVKPLARPSRQNLAAKSRPVNAKDVRRVKQLDRRNNQKYIDMMKRRGLMS